MGYRSDVKIVFYLTHGTTDAPATETNPVLTFPALKLWFEETYPIKEAKDDWGVEIDYGDDHILLNWLRKFSCYIKSLFNLFN